MDNISKLAVADFSLARSGQLHKILRFLNLSDSTVKGYTKRSVALSGLTWLPLLILAALQGLAWGNRVEMNFLKDFATHCRLLLVIPLLIFSEHSVDTRIIELTAQFFKAGILTEEDLPAFSRLKNQVKKLSDTPLADIVILVIVISNIIIRSIKYGALGSTWVFIPDTDGIHFSWAGLWFAFISLPMLQYILLRWLWRWIIWVIYFTKISRMHLHLNSAHPDKAGGIGFLGIPPAPFLYVTLAMSILFSVVIAEKVIWFHERLPTFYPLLIAFAVISIVINVLPLIVYMAPLAKQRRKGIFEYSTLIQKHHREFDTKWIGEADTHELLGSPDPSSTTDLNSTYDVVMGMRIFPFNLKTMFSSILIAILPMVPLMAFEYNWLDVLKKVIGLLL